MIWRTRCRSGATKESSRGSLGGRLAPEVDRSVARHENDASVTWVWPEEGLSAMNDPPIACVIGAGSSGITAAKALLDHGIPFDALEMSDRVGGNWAIDNPNQVSSAYRSLHI